MIKMKPNDAGASVSGGGDAVGDVAFIAQFCPVALTTCQASAPCATFLSGTMAADNGAGPTPAELAAAGNEAQALYGCMMKIQLIVDRGGDNNETDVDNGDATTANLDSNNRTICKCFKCSGIECTPPDCKTCGTAETNAQFCAADPTPTSVCYTSHSAECQCGLSIALSSGADGGGGRTRRNAEHIQRRYEGGDRTRRRFRDDSWLTPSGERTRQRNANRRRNGDGGWIKCDSFGRHL
jgi:hypothetical protein